MIKKMAEVDGAVKIGDVVGLIHNRLQGRELEMTILAGTLSVG